MNVRPVTNPAALRFLEARIDETDDHEATKRQERLKINSLWVMQDRTDAGGESARRGVRVILEKHAGREDFEPAWLA